MRRRESARRVDVPASGAPFRNLGAFFIPLALQNFLMVYNSTAMNVAISSEVTDLHTTLTGVQRTAGTLASVFAKATARPSGDSHPAADAATANGGDRHGR